MVVAVSVKVEQSNIAPTATVSVADAFRIILELSSTVLVLVPVPTVKLMLFVLIPAAVDEKVCVPLALLNLTFRVPEPNELFKSPAPDTEKLPAIFNATAPLPAVFVFMSMVPPLMATSPVTFTVAVPALLLPGNVVVLLQRLEAHYLS